MIKAKTTIDELVGNGWVDKNIKFADLHIYAKGDYRVLYDNESDRLVAFYKKGEIGKLNELEGFEGW